jgi:hypothetical protein
MHTYQVVSNVAKAVLKGIQPSQPKRPCTVCPTTRNRRQLDIGGCIVYKEALLEEPQEDQFIVH